MNTEQLHQLEQLAAAATPGPWTWDFRPGSHTISLMSGWNTVLDTKRWGSQGATIRMLDPAMPSCLLPLHVDAVPHAGREHHKDWALTINPARADAAYIAAAHPAAVLALLARVNALQSALESATDTNRVLATRLQGVAAILDERKACAMSDSALYDEDSEEQNSANLRYMEMCLVEQALNPQLALPLETPTA